MSNERRTQANRINAKASTGPRTSQGKARAARNARQHGLSFPALADPAWSVEIKALAREIAGHGASAELLELAAGIAAAHIDLVRVQQARHQIIAEGLNNRHNEKPTKGVLRERWLHCKYGGPVKETAPVPKANGVATVGEFAEVLTDLSANLILMDRYERRARSRRKFAIRAFDCARIGTTFKDVEPAGK